MHPPQETDDFSDLLRDAQEIADYIDEPYRKTCYLLETKQLPAWKFAGRWRSTKSKIRARLLGEEEAA